MLEELSDKVGYFILTDRQNEQTAPFLAKLGAREAQITGEKSRVRESQEKSKDFFVGHSFVPQLDANLADWNSPTSQQLALALQNVFIQNVHGLARLNGQLVSVFLEGFAGQTHRFSDGFLGDASAPFFDNAFPCHAGGDLF